ncbi:MAG: hypothetical protein ACOC8N_09060 [Spirochaetota bacterium]
MRTIQARESERMFKTRPVSAYVLSAAIALLAAAAAAGGLFIHGLYRDNPFVTAIWWGNDLVTLAVAFPVLAASLALSLRGSLWARLVWLGMLDYTLYNFAFYLFGAAFNAFFLVYTALFALSILALLFSLSRIDLRAVGHAFGAGGCTQGAEVAGAGAGGTGPAGHGIAGRGVPVRWIAGYMLLVAAGLCVIEVSQSLRFVFTGELPPVVARVAHPTSVVFGLDLSLMVPFLVLGAVWLWRRRPWGFVLGVILNVKGTVYTLALVAASVFAARAGFPEAAGELPVWLFFTAGGLASSVLLLAGVRSKGGEVHETGTK